MYYHSAMPPNNMYQPWGIHPVPYHENYRNYYQQQQYDPYREQGYFPPVDTAGFSKSAHQFQALMQQASLLINAIVNSKDFANQLMSAAQSSNQKKVEQLIKSTGIKIKIQVKFTPTAIQIYLDNSTEEIACCSMLVGLRW